MIITVQILGAQGGCVSRDELATLFAADMHMVPWRRKSVVSDKGVVTLTMPEGPVVLEAKLIIPGYGHIWVSADNEGRGYADGASVEFVREAAKSRLADVDAVLRGGGFTPSVKCLSMRNDGETLITLAGKASGEKQAAFNMAALASLLWAGDLAVVERARARIAARQPRKDFLFGCAGFEYPYENQPEVREAFDKVFNYATLPFYLNRVEREKFKPDYPTLEKLQSAFEAQGTVTKGHPLWWAHTAGMPPWTLDLKWDGGRDAEGTITHEIRRVVRDRVNHFKGRIHLYDVINEAHDWCNSWNMRQDELIAMTKTCAEAVKDVDPTCAAVINTCFMFGENAADGRVQWGIQNERNMVPWSYIKKVCEAGTDFDFIGMQLYNPARDMLAIDKLYDRFAVFGKPYHITELGVPSSDEDVGPATTEGDIYCLRYMYKGLWHEMGWNERVQADWIEDFYTISYARPEVRALTWWSVQDGHSYVPAAGIVNRDGTPKEGLLRLSALEKSWGVGPK